MAKQKTSEKLRSKMTNKIFHSFITALRAEPSIEHDVADRLETALNSVVAITPANLQDALFPPNPQKEK